MDKLSVTILVVAACGGGHSKAPPDSPGSGSGTPDAMVDALMPGPNLVTLQVVGGTPALVAYRDGAGPWQVPAGAGGTYTLHVTDEYQAEIVCTTGGFISTELHDATYADTQSIFTGCLSDNPPPTEVAITGTMEQAGTIQAGSSQSSTTAPWTYTLQVDPGTLDLYANDSTSIEIQRGLAISGATTLPTVDLSQTGSAMASAPFTITNLASSETVSSSVAWFTANGAAFIDGTSAKLLAPPRSLIASADSLLAGVFTFSETSFRSANGPMPTSATSYTLMPLPVVTWVPSGNTIAATWTSLPTYDDVQLGLSSSASTIEVIATQGWLATHGDRLQLDTAPGYQASWNVDTTGSYSRDFDVDHAVGESSYSSDASDNVNGAAARPVERVRLRAACAFAARSSSRSSWSARSSACCSPTSSTASCASSWSRRSKTD